MKLKGIKPVEQHVEKIVLIAVSAVFLLVLAMQFLVEPNLVKVGRADPVPPGRAFDDVERKARELAARMDTAEVENELPPPVQGGMVDRFNRLREASVAPRAALASLGPVAQIEGTTGLGTAHGPAQLAEVRIPAPGGPVGYAFWSTIDPAEVVARPELAALLPKQQPFDKAAVSIEATFDGGALTKSLLEDPDGDGPIRAVPANWWRQSVEIVGVELQREELSPGGEWAGQVRVPTPPGMLDLVAELSKEDRLQAGVLLDEARQFAQDIQRPAFYSAIAGTPWAPPTEARATIAQTASVEVQRQVEELDRVRQDLADIKAQIAALPQPEGERGGGGGRSPRAPGGDDRQRTAAQVERDRRALALRERSLEASEGRIIGRLREAGVDPDRVAPPAQQQTDQRETLAQRPLLDNPQVRLWSHDLTAEPGKTYRYRVRALINNPAFGRGASLIPEQQALAERPYLESQPSAWSRPVSVPSETYFFVTSAREGTAFGSAGASAEVYKVYYGYFRKGTIGLEPGDAVHIASLKLPDPDKLPIYDLAALRGEEPDRPAGDDLRARQGFQEAVREPGVGGRAGVQPGPRTLPVSIEAVLLDVARAPGVAERVQAVFRGTDGRVTVRRPDEDRTSETYRLVTTSAKEGETQGEPPALREVEDRRETPQPRPRDPREPGPGGGGGGGGGG